MAEGFLKENLNDYLVLRLSFPFGKGESSNRLISRLINKIKNRESLEIDNLELSLMHIGNLKNDICELISLNGPIVQYLNARFVSLEEILKYICDNLGIQGNWCVRNSTPQSILADPEIFKLEKDIDPFPAIQSMI